MTMKFDTPSQDARLNEAFTTLSMAEKEAVLTLVAKARKTSGIHREGAAFAYKQSSDGKIVWGITDSVGGFIRVPPSARGGVFPE